MKHNGQNQDINRWIYNSSWTLQYLTFKSGQKNQNEDLEGNRGLEYHKAIIAERHTQNTNKNEVLIHVTSLMNSETIVLNINIYKPDTKGQMLYNSTYVKDLEQANSQRQKQVRGYYGLGE